MTTIKVKTKVTEEREIEKEIKIPYYSKDGNHCYKVYADQKNISVYVSGAGSVSIMDYDTFNDFSKAISFPEISEQEFNDHFEKALDILKANVGLWITVSPLPDPSDYGLDPNGNIQQRDTNLVTC